MKSKILISLILIFLFSFRIQACLNGETKILTDGNLLYEDREGNTPYGHDFKREKFKKEISHLETLYKNTKNIDYLSDKGLLLILLKKYHQAIELYLAIEELEPDRYSTAANLGTAYELIENNWLALKWIKKAVRLNPYSHKNSEWIHLRILRSKIKGLKFITSKFLIKTDFGTDNIPKTSLSKDELLKLHNALFYQLNERMSFAKPKHKILAQLLFDLGNIAFLLEKNFDANEDYKLAKEYGLQNQLIDKRIAKNNEIIKHRIEKAFTSKKTTISPNFKFLFGALGTATALLIPILIYRRKRKIKIHNPFIRIHSPQLRKKKKIHFDI